MEYGDLPVLEAVARHGSMNRAAVELNMVQSNVTARGSVHIGALETTAAPRLPPILTVYTQAYPEVALVVTTGTSCNLVEDVLAHRLDGVFVAGPVHHADLLEELVFREELMLITSPSLRDLDDLGRQRKLKIIVFRHGCSYRQRLENLLTRRGIQTAKPLEFGSLDAIMGYVAAGVGITLLPKAVVASSRQEGLVLAHELPPEEARVATMFIRRSDVYASSALNAFLAVARPSPLKLVVGD